MNKKLNDKARAVVVEASDRVRKYLQEADIKEVEITEFIGDAKDMSQANVDAPAKNCQLVITFAVK